MRNLLRTAVTAATALVAIGVVGPLHLDVVAAPVTPNTPGTSWQPQGWWCRLTHLC